MAGGGTAISVSTAMPDDSTCQLIGMGSIYSDESRNNEVHFIPSYMNLSDNVFSANREAIHDLRDYVKNQSFGGLIRSALRVYGDSETKHVES